MNASPAVSFGCTALMGSNKRGIVKCNDDGYYPLVLGALNTFNSAGAYYPMGPAKALFEKSSAFMRRVNSGNLRGECGHPRKRPGDTDRDFAMRLNDIYEPNVSHHIRRVWLQDGAKDEAGRPIILIMGEVKPSGPRGAALKDQLENRHEDVCFSIRSFTHDIPVCGIWQKHLRQIVTWDWVNEPGISAAHKWQAPSLESYEESQLTRELIMTMVAKERIAGISLEAGQPSLTSVAAAMGWLKPIKVEQPASSKW